MGVTFFFLGNAFSNIRIGRLLETVYSKMSIVWCLHSPFIIQYFCSNLKKRIITAERFHINALALYGCRMSLEHQFLFVVLFIIRNANKTNFLIVLGGSE